MSNQRSESFKVDSGQKLTPAEEAAADPNTARQLSASGPQKEVEGQRRYDDWTRCPYCSDVGWVEGLSTWRRILVRCCNSACLRLFWAPHDSAR
jgi:hypothetical protein